MVMTVTRSGSGAPTLMEAMTASPPDPEVPDKATRRRFSIDYKLAVLKQADACRDPGEIGALLRREGLYSSHLSEWRRQRTEGLLGVKRGRQPKDRLEAENEALRAENKRLHVRVEQAEAVIEVQKKLSRLLGIAPETTGSDER